MILYCGILQKLGTAVFSGPIFYDLSLWSQRDTRNKVWKEVAEIAGESAGMCCSQTSKQVFKCSRRYPEHMHWLLFQRT